MELSPKQKKELEENLKQQFIEIKNHFKQNFNKNELCRIAAIQQIELADLKEALKQYYEKFGALHEEVEEEKK